MCKTVKKKKKSELLFFLMYYTECLNSFHFISSQTSLGRAFWRAVGEVVKFNADMDFLSSTRSDPVYHFDSERVDSAMAMLRQFWTQAVLSVRAKQYQSARQSLGRLFHSLQVHCTLCIYNLIMSNGVKVAALE